MISLFRNLGFLVEGAPKGNYDVELVMSQYKSCSVFKRYYVPLMHKLPEESKVGINVEFLLLTLPVGSSTTLQHPISIHC